MTFDPRCDNDRSIMTKLLPEHDDVCRVFSMDTVGSLPCSILSIMVFFQCLLWMFVDNVLPAANIILSSVARISNGPRILHGNCLATSLASCHVSLQGTLDCLCSIVILCLDFTPDKRGSSPFRRRLSSRHQLCDGDRDAMDCHCVLHLGAIHKAVCLSA